MVKDYERTICLLIDMSVATDDNISVKEYNKISKYKDQEIETEKMWHLKTTIMSVIVGAQGIIKKETDKHLYKIQGSPIWNTKNCSLWNYSSP